MKKVIFTVAAMLLFGMSIYGQYPLSLKSDTTAQGTLGFTKKNNWAIPLRDSIKFQNFDFQRLKGKKSSLLSSFQNMPVLKPDGYHSMPIHTPDTTTTYKMRVLSVE